MPIYKDETRGTYTVKVSHTDKFGKRKYSTKRGFKMRREAKQWEDNYFIALEDNSLINGLSFETLSKHYYDWYKEKNKLSSSDSLKSHIKVNLKPFFQNVNVHNMTAQDILKWHEYMKGKELSTSYIISAQGHLTGMLNHGIRFFDLKTNVSSIAGNIKDTDKVERNVWKLEEFERFYSLIDDVQHKALFRTLFFSGMRKGELRALTWEDIHFDLGYIDINKTNYKGVIQPPKSKSSNRLVYMPQHTMDILQQYKSWYKANQPYKESYVIFGSFHKAVSETTIDRWYDRYQTGSGLKRIKIHEFRHSHITDCIFRAGMKKDLVMKRVGHANLNYIDEVYSNPYSDIQKQAADSL